MRDHCRLLIIILGWWGLSSSVVAMPQSYALTHKAWCEENRSHDDISRTLCANRAWCAAHRQDDRISALACDPFQSKADISKLRWTVSGGALDRAATLNISEQLSGCDPHRCVRKNGWPSARGFDWGLLPQGVAAAKLALRADIAVYVFPITVVKIALISSHSGVLSLTWSDNGNGLRRAVTLPLSQNEIDRLLAAMNRADFWRLPHQGGHIGPTDGEVATVEVSAEGHKNNVTDTIGDTEAVDLSILVHAISAIIGAHWKNVPGGA